MSLSRMRPLLERARHDNRAIGAFSVANLEMILGVLAAAEKAQAPVILQIAQARLQTSPLHMIGPAMLEAARRSKVEVAVHLDHGLTMDCMEEAIGLGFTSVMFDGSHLPFAENVRLTREVVAMAHGKAVDVEAEIGRVGRGEDEAASPVAYADPREALRFLAETGVDALAVGIGNIHGVYAGAPDLHFEILREISAASAVPLVLHGGTGISPADFRQAISLGVRKINIATACFRAAAEAAHAARQSDIFDVSRCMADAVEAVAAAHLSVFYPA